jgi:hypothetical protein
MKEQLMESIGRIVVAIGVAIAVFAFARGPIRYPGATFLLCLLLGLSAVFGKDEAAAPLAFIGGSVVLYLIYQNRKRIDREWVFIILFCGGLLGFVFYYGR